MRRVALYARVKIKWSGPTTSANSLRASPHFHLGRMNSMARPSLSVKSASDLVRHYKITETDCWEWQRGRTSAGYGIVSFHGRRLMAHRVSWCLHNNQPYPEKKLDVCHRCDNPPCINPAHLFLANRSINMRDCVEKGRHSQHEAKFCKQGHPRTPENLYIIRRKSGRLQYMCKICQAARSHAWGVRKKGSSA